MEAGLFSKSSSGFSARFLFSVMIIDQEQLALSYEHREHLSKENSAVVALAFEEISRHAENSSQTMDHGWSSECGWHDPAKAASANS